MAFNNISIKTFGLSELIGRTITVRSFKDDGCELIVAVDTKSGELFVMKENIYPSCSEGN